MAILSEITKCVMFMLIAGYSICIAQKIIENQKMHQVQIKNQKIIIEKLDSILKEKTPH